MQIQLNFTLVPQDRQVPATRDLFVCGQVLAEAGLEHQAHARGFYVEGPWNEVFTSLKRCQEEVLATNPDHVTSVIELGVSADRQREEVDRSGKAPAKARQTAGGSELQSPSLPGGPYRLVEQPPDAESFRLLRELNGLSVRNEEAARRGLAQSLFGCHLLYGASPTDLRISVPCRSTGRPALSGSKSPTSRARSFSATRSTSRHYVRPASKAAVGATKAVMHMTHEPDPAIC